METWVESLAEVAAHKSTQSPLFEILVVTSIDRATMDCPITTWYFHYTVQSELTKWSTKMTAEIFRLAHNKATSPHPGSYISSIWFIWGEAKGFYSVCCWAINLWLYFWFAPVAQPHCISVLYFIYYIFVSDGFLLNIFFRHSHTLCAVQSLDLANPIIVLWAYNSTVMHVAYLIKYTMWGK